MARLVWVSFHTTSSDRANKTVIIASATLDVVWLFVSIRISGGNKTIAYRSEPHGPKNQRAIIRPNWIDPYQIKRPGKFPIPVRITSTTFTKITAEERNESTNKGGLNHKGKKSCTGEPCKR